MISVRQILVIPRINYSYFKSRDTHVLMCLLLQMVDIQIWG